MLLQHGAIPAYFRMAHSGLKSHPAEAPGQTCRRASRGAKYHMIYASAMNGPEPEIRQADARR